MQCDISNQVCDKYSYRPFTNSECFELPIGTLPGGGDAPWVDKHKPKTAVSLLAITLPYVHSH